MKRFKNYLGQLRLYSLADLTLLLIAIQAHRPQFVGAIILHLAFLAYLESRHSHSYRFKVPYWISYLLALIGLIFYGKFEGIMYLVFGFLYTQKIKRLGFMSPVFRGFQNLFIVAGIIGYHSSLTYIVGGLLVVRNLVGDFRDVEKDKKEGMKTIPVIMGMSRNIKYIHFMFTILTSTIWWYLSTLSVAWLIVVIIIQGVTYNLTAR